MDIPESHELLTLTKANKTDLVLELLKTIDEVWLIRSIHGESALHWAAVNNNDVLIKALIEKGLNANDMNFRGTAPLYYGAMNNASDACLMLIKHGADPREKSGFSGQYPDEVVKVSPEKEAEFFSGIGNLDVDSMDSDLQLKVLLTMIRMEVEETIEKNISLHHVYRMRKWGIQTLVYKIQYKVMPKHLFRSQWGNEWKLRPDLADINDIPALSKIIEVEWEKFEFATMETTNDDKICACCGSNVGIKKRCSKCKKIYFCNIECQRLAHNLHQSLGCK